MFKVILFVVFTSFFSSNCLQARPEKTLERLVRSTGIKKDNVGVSIQDIRSPDNIYSFNDDKPFSIASVNKLFITAAALKYLGKDYRFTTEIYGDLPDEEGVVRGNLYIVGGGDPLFVSESMWFLVNKLVNTGIKKIEGNIILDDSQFPCSDVYEQGGSDRAYNARISALSVNFNSIAASVVSGPRPKISLDPLVPSIKLVDNTRKSRRRTALNVSMRNNNFLVSGNLNNQDYSRQYFYRNVPDTGRYFAEVLNMHLGWRGIKLDGVIRQGKNDDSSNKLFEMKSRRLVDIIIEMNKFSSNFIAEQLLRAIAKKQFGDASKTEKTINMISSYMVTLGLNTSGFNMVNGSGFSRNNVAKPKEIVKFLRVIYDDFDIGPEFLSSLSIAGVDGTIKDVHRTNFMYERVRGKTGTLSGVRALAGYISYEGKHYAFMIVANDPNAYKMIDWEDRVLSSFLRN